MRPSTGAAPVASQAAPNSPSPSPIALRALARDWIRTEGLTWVYIAKAVAAGLLALYIAMRLELPSPRTALTTVFVVMTPQSGMVLAKSFYRILGTLVGLCAMLTLISLFSQAHVLFLLGTALWIGVCTAGSARNRNFRSYGFLLAGYTAALIGVSNAEAPLGAFDASVTRVIEVSLGIMCSAVVSSVVFPRRSSSLLRAQLTMRFSRFMQFIGEAMHGDLDRAALEQRNMQFVADVVGMESLRSFSIFEDPLVRLQSGKWDRFNSESMAASTRFHALHELLKRMNVAGDGAAAAVTALQTHLHALSEQIAAAVDPATDAAEEIRRLRQLIQGLSDYRDNFAENVRRSRDTYAAVLAGTNAPVGRLRDFDTASELLYRFALDLHAYVSTFTAIHAPADTRLTATPSKARVTYRYTPKTNALMAGIAGGRAAVTLLLVATFWYYSSWPAGDFATLTAGTVCALISASPQPARAAVQMVWGSFLAASGGYIVNFLVFPGREGFLLMASGLVPFLMFGAWLTTRPKYLPAGLGYCIFFCLLAGPDNLTLYDPVTYLNNSVALVVAMMISAASFGILLPPTTRWLLRRMEADLRGQVAKAAFGRPSGLSHRLDSQTRDFMFQIGGLTAENPALKRHMLGWMFAVLEVGHALIELRGETAALTRAAPGRGAISNSSRAALQHMQRAVVTLFTKPNAPAWQRALQSTNLAIEHIEQIGKIEDPHSELHDGWRALLSYLHFIRTALLDEDSPLAAFATAAETEIATRTATPSHRETSQ